MSQDQGFEQLINKMHPQGKLLRTWPLQGGISAQVMGLKIALPGGEIQKMVMRLHGDVDFNNNPNIAADEFKLLQLLRTVGLPVPTPYFLDATNEIFSRPYLVVEFVDGSTEPASTDLAHYINLFTEQLVHIHQVDYTDLTFLPTKNYHHVLEQPELPETSHISKALKAVWPLPQLNSSVLLHGDYWPGNILWKDGQIAAVIDWEDAGLGDPLVDLANSRLELLLLFGIGAMDAFTQHYQSMMPTANLTDLPYWDLCIALDVAPRISGWGEDTIALQNGLKLFIAQAFEKLGTANINR